MSSSEHLEQNMYMSMSIASYGPSTLGKFERQVSPERSQRNPLDYSDVEGTKPQNRFNAYTNKPDLWNNADVQGSTSKVLHKSRNSLDKSLYIDDIEGARAKIRDKFLFTKRSVDPLNPQYSLPTFTPAEPYEPKFLRDSVRVDDIDGAMTKAPINFKGRETMNTSDIEGAQACWRPRHSRVRLEAPPQDNLDVNDISRRTHRHIDHTSRVTDVLDPVYRLNELEICDNLKYTKPTKNPPFFPETKLLMISDIEGAQPGWIPPMRFNPPMEKRREFRNTNYIQDIEGAHSDTVIKSIITDRRTNPLIPTYQSLDPGNILPPPHDPLIPLSFYTEKAKNASNKKTTSTSPSSQLIGERQPETNNTSSPRISFHQDKEHGARSPSSTNIDQKKSHKPDNNYPVNSSRSPLSHPSEPKTISNQSDLVSSRKYPSSSKQDEMMYTNSPSNNNNSNYYDNNNNNDYPAVSYAEKFTEKEESLIGSSGKSSMRSSRDFNDTKPPRANLDAKPRPHSTVYAGKGTEDHFTSQAKLKDDVLDFPKNTLLTQAKKSSTFSALQNSSLRLDLSVANNANATRPQTEYNSAANSRRPSARSSPANSGRNIMMLSPAEKRLEREKTEEINSVRNL